MCTNPAQEASMRRVHLLAVAMIAIALGAGATVKSDTSARLLPATRQALPIPQPAGTAQSGTMPIVIVPAEAVDPTAMLYLETGDGSNGSSIRR
jgi:hypothetical protein